MTKKRFIIYIFSIIAVSIALVMLQKNLRQGEVCLRDHCFSVEIAKTRISRASGLMFRRELPFNRGMLFVFDDEKPRSFWMKNTLIPLDMIFFNKSKEVVAIKKNVQPCAAEDCPKIRPEERAKYVLELNGNISDQIGLKIGDRMQFNRD